MPRKQSKKVASSLYGRTVPKRTKAEWDALEQLRREAFPHLYNANGTRK